MPLNPLRLHIRTLPQRQHFPHTNLCQGGNVCRLTAPRVEVPFCRGLGSGCAAARMLTFSEYLESPFRFAELWTRRQLFLRLGVV